MITTTLLTGALVFGGGSVSPTPSSVPAPTIRYEEEVCPLPDASEATPWAWAARIARCMIRAFPVTNTCRKYGWRGSECREAVSGLARKCTKGIPVVGDIMMIVDCFIDNEGDRLKILVCIVGGAMGAGGIENILPGRKT